MISPRYLRRIINRFVLFGKMDLLAGGGCMLSINDCDFRLTEISIWSSRTHLTEYTFLGRGWTLRAIDSPNGCGKRLLQIIAQRGKESLITSDMGKIGR